MKFAYADCALRAPSLLLVEHANTIIEEYQVAGFDLTLRQLYYQFVARNLLPNTERSYKRLGSVINDARLCGLVDWESISDRTRYLRALSHWSEPADIIEQAARQFRIDRWAEQEFRLEVWIEKDALVGVIEGVCNEWDVPFFSCRGYTSQSEMWRAAMRLKEHAGDEQTPVILHLGDHDPSGIDMSRDIEDRLRLFLAGRGYHHTPLEFDRLALNFGQIEEYGPPPNPAKMTDSRFSAYEERFGSQSWELDSMDPRAISDLVRGAIESRVERNQWKRDTKRQEIMRKRLNDLASAEQRQKGHGRGKS